ncbi:MAG: hydrolase [Gammaproteobacteria bacterium]|nr:MAG: hydrolase [Gammaproteobacteria bacterium]RKZ96773.1 MAG: hydrolase [Gammaproteobacteria bacterium]
MTNINEHIDRYFADRLTPDNAALLLVDHQSGLALGIETMNPETFRNNVVAMAKIGKIFKLPTIITTSADTGPNGPLMPEITNVFPDVEIIRREGEINAWDAPKFKKTVEATGRKKLIIAGISTDVCLLFPVLSAIAEGYDVYAVFDSSGTWNDIAQQATMMRLAQAGCKTTNWVSVAAELQNDWRNSTGEELAALFSEHLSFYGHLISNLTAPV